MSSAVTSSLLCVVAFAVVVVFAFLANAIRIVPEYQRLVVFRLGRCVGEKGPGLILLIPVIDRSSQGDSSPDLHYQG
jgi:regulator of protease activity HflC (stomatin/prohibitin superfamily)